MSVTPDSRQQLAVAGPTASGCLLSRSGHSRFRCELSQSDSSAEDTGERGHHPWRTNFMQRGTPVNSNLLLLWYVFSLRQHLTSPGIRDGRNREHLRRRLSEERGIGLQSKQNPARGFQNPRMNADVQGHRMDVAKD